VNSLEQTNKSALLTVNSLSVITMEGSEIGLFGTLRLMKRTTDEQVAAFPIDEETVTFGRDPTCSVRLYYPEISALHAKIVFRERKVRGTFI
jgi:hypothetical protein